MKALEMIAPGTALREGIDSIVHAKTGGLIVIGEPEDLSFLNSGGIKLEIDYTPAFLYQVAKMDGAIILNVNATKITMANVQLMPDPTILSHETGTRHRTAERVSKQTDALVIAISQRREVVSVYVDGTKYILQRSELVTRMAVEIERYIVELGSEGRLIELQLEETMVGAAAEKAALMRDYLSSYSDEAYAAALEEIGRLPHQDLLDFGRLAELLGYDRKLNTLDYPVSPRGFRVLGRIPRLPKLVVSQIVGVFGGLDELLAATDAELEGIEGVGEIRAKDIREGLRRLQELNLVDRYLQT
jgi:diadenylate cyclase